MKIAYILLSNGLEYDDRIRKEMFSIREIMGDVEFKIFAFSGANNYAGSGVLSYGVPFEFVPIANRSSKKNSLLSLLQKEYSLYSQVTKRIKEYDLLWVCDSQPFFFPLFSKKPVIWDLHEIPSAIIGGRIKNILFHHMERRCKWLIHANQERLEYLMKVGAIKKPNKSIIIRNYPDNAWLNEFHDRSASFLKFKQWLGNEEYLYVQGIFGPGRYAWETLSAIMEAKRIKAVVVGNVPSDIKDRIKEKYPEAFHFLYFTGQLVQSETAAFIYNCKFSLVFYRSNTPNNRYCEPNRMFQSLGMGKPVIVGCNESMKSIVDKYGNGCALQSDGGIISDDVMAIHRMLDNYDLYSSKAEKYKLLFAWESQLAMFKTLFSED